MHFNFKAPEREFFVLTIMKISKYYIDNAKYRAEDDSGNVIWLEVDYWNNEYKLSQDNSDLSNFEKKLLSKKHRKNLVHKMLE